MRLPTVLLSFLLAVSSFVSANPFPGGSGDGDSWDGLDGRHPRHGCLSDSSASKIVSNFESFFVKLDPKLAVRTLAPDFQEFSDSINFITPNGPRTPGAVTEPSRAKFINDTLATQGSGPSPGFTTLAVYHSCDTITFRWQLNMQPTALRGIDVLIIKPGTHLIQTDYSEYNNLLFLVDIGCTVTGGPCSPPS